MADDDRDRSVASGFPAPEDVPGPTERLRKMHGEEGEQPAAPKYGRAPRGRAATADQAPLAEVVAQPRGGGPKSASALDNLARRVGDEAASRAQQEFERRGIAERIQNAEAGVQQLAVAGVLGACAAGAATAGVIVLWHKVLPLWAAALATSGTLALAAAPIAVLGRKQLKQSVALKGQSSA